MPSKHDFSFPRKTRLGALVLLIVLLILIVFWRLLPSMIHPKVDPEEIALQQAWGKFEKENVTIAAPTQKEDHYSSQDGSNKEDNKETDTLFLFNPNTASETELLELGLPKHTVKTILKYRAKSLAAFKKKEDLAKLYTLSKKDYDRIAPFVRIPEERKEVAVPHDHPVDSKERNEAHTIELNATTAEELMSLRGIGPGYSKRIINFRNGLGGFIKVEQLQEVFGFPDSTYQQLKSRFRVNVTLVKQINVNIADEETLARQTYIGRKLAGNIIKLRNDLKQFKEIEQLRQVPLINDEKYRKIAPYLSTH
jgi:competence protein ComEA